MIARGKRNPFFWVAYILAKELSLVNSGSIGTVEGGG
jgi:hypothetical protein